MINFLISSCLMAILNVCLFCLLAKPIRFSVRRFAGILVSSAVFFSLIGVLGHIFGDPRYPERVFLVIRLMTFLMCFLISRIDAHYSLFRFLVVYGFSAEAMVIAEFLSVLSVKVFFPEMAHAWITESLMLLISFILYSVFLVRPIREAFAYLKSEGKRIFAALVIIDLFLVLLSYWIFQQNQDKLEYVLAFSSVLILGLLLALMMRSVLLLYQKQEEEEKLITLQKEVKLAEVRYQHLQEDIERARHFRHDLKFHLRCLKRLADQKDYEGIERILGEYQIRTDSLKISMQAYSHHPTVNLMMQYFVHAAEQQGIQTFVDVRVPDYLGIEDADLISVLGNLWQNALEALKEHKTEKLFIEFKLVAKNGQLLIRTVNPVGTIKRDSHGNFLTTKGAGHGLGIASLEKTASRYKGYTSFAVKDGRFTAVVVLYEQNQTI